MIICLNERPRGRAGLDLGPSCPGVVKTRPASQLAKIPKDSNIFEVFNELTGNSDLSDEEAFFEFIACYDVTLKEICLISCMAS
jgi:hypothetical protein